MEEAPALWRLLEKRRTAPRLLKKRDPSELPRMEMAGPGLRFRTSRRVTPDPSAESSSTNPGKLINYNKAESMQARSPSMHCERPSEKLLSPRISGAHD